MSESVGYPVHTLAEIFPMPSEETYKGMEQDILANGQLEPIVLYQDSVIDGRTRQKILLKHGIEPKYKDLPKGADPVAFVLSKNLHRRHLSESQRAMTAARILRLRKDQAYEEAVKNMEEVDDGKAVTVEGNGANGHVAGAPTVQEISDFMNVSKSAVRHANIVQEKCAVDIVRAVDADELSASDAAAIAELPKAQQLEALKKVKEGAARTLKEASGVSQEEVKQKLRNTQDDLGSPVPARLRDLFADRTLKRAVEAINELCRYAKRTQKKNPYFQLAKLLESADVLGEMVEAATPYAVHQACEGKGCELCRQSGWLPAWREKELRG